MLSSAKTGSRLWSLQTLQHTLPGAFEKGRKFTIYLSTNRMMCSVSIINTVSSIILKKQVYTFITSFMNPKMHIFSHLKLLSVGVYLTAAAGLVAVVKELSLLAQAQTCHSCSWGISIERCAWLSPLVLSPQATYNVFKIPSMV